MLPNKSMQIQCDLGWTLGIKMNSVNERLIYQLTLRIPFDTQHHTWNADSIVTNQSTSDVFSVFICVWLLYNVIESWQNIRYCLFIVNFYIRKLIPDKA